MPGAHTRKALISVKLLIAAKLNLCVNILLTFPLESVANVWANGPAVQAITLIVNGTASLGIIPQQGKNL